MLGGLEAFWRAHGHRPSVVDSKDLWSFERRRAVGSDAVVLIGDSRMQLDFDTAEFARRFPDRPLIDLALEGEPPLATLCDLADDPAFSGTILCSGPAQVFERRERDQQRAWVRWFHDRARLNGMGNAWLGAVVQSHLVITSPQVRLTAVLERLLNHEPLPEPAYVVTLADRSRAADYTRIGIAAHRAWRIARQRDGYARRHIPTPVVWRREAEDLREPIARLQARGGRVVFVCFPTSGEHWQLDEHYYPRTAYWHQLAAATGAATVHFADFPELSAFTCPDTSHLDAKDKPRFTRALLDVLERRGLLSGAEPAARPGR